MFKNNWTKSKNQPVDWGLLGFPPNVALMEAEKMYHRYSNLLEKSTSRWILLASPIKDGNFSFVAAWQSWRRSRNTNIKSLLTDEEDNRSQQFILQPILLNISYFLLKHIFRVICFFTFQHSARKMGFPATILALFRFFHTSLLKLIYIYSNLIYILRFFTPAHLSCCAELSWCNDWRQKVSS